VVADVSGKLHDVLGKDGFIIDQLTINGALLRCPRTCHSHQPRDGSDPDRHPGREPGAWQVKAEADQAMRAGARPRRGRQAARQGEADAVLIRARADAKIERDHPPFTSGSVLQYRANRAVGCSFP